MNLTFRTVPIIETGLGKISVLPKVCSELNVKKPIIITDNGLFDLGFVDIIIENLKKNDVQACIFKDVLADPPESNIFDAVKIFHVDLW